MQLADVEHQRDAFQLGDRELPEPLLVEARQGSDAQPRFVELGGLVDDADLVLGGPTEHDDVRAGRARPRDEQLVRRFVDCLGGRQGAGDDRGTLGPAAQLDREALRFVRPGDEHDPIAVPGSVLGARRRRRTEHVPRHQDECGAEDDEAGKQRVPGEELERGDRQRPEGAGRHGRTPTVPARAEVGQADAVRSDPEHHDVRDRPGEPERSRVVVHVADRVQLAQAENGDGDPGEKEETSEAAHRPHYWRARLEARDGHPAEHG